MQPDRWQKIEHLFNETLKLPYHERKDFIAKNCDGDSDLCHEVINLVNESNSSDDFLSHSAFSLGAQLLNEEFEVLLKNSDFGFYKLKQLLGRGGVGAVFVAVDTRLKREVALKILPAVLTESDERVLRFRQEAQLASAISHPNIAHIYEFGSHNGYYFLAMEYIEGKTLRHYLKSKHPDLAVTLNFIKEIAAALSAAHQAGIIHRDIKPENIIITKKRNVKILDFGLAKLKDSISHSHNSNGLFNSSLITTPGLIIGTVAYMSPEQAENKELDELTDIWSLGVLFYEMLTGHHPFLKESNIETLHGILKEPPNRLAEATELIPNHLLNMATRCLTKDKRERIQSADELLRELEMIQKTEGLFDRRRNGRRGLGILRRVKKWFHLTNLTDR